METFLAGNYEGVASVGKIRSLGNVGLGTFAGLDGEMIILTVYSRRRQEK